MFVDQSLKISSDVEKPLGIGNLPCDKTTALHFILKSQLNLLHLYLLLSECTRSMCYNGGTVDTKSCTCRCPTVSWLEASEDCASE